MGGLNLHLVRIINKEDNSTNYFGVNDKHLDAMLNSGGTDLDLIFYWGLEGKVNISEDILNEQGYYRKVK